MESDEEIRRVPEVGLELAGPSTSGREATAAAVATAGTSSASQAASAARRRGRSPADKEYRRLKRLLRNRVSAQQARERKKAYLSELEVRVKDLEERNSELEERLSTLQNENQMLRQILKNTTVNRRGGPGLHRNKLDAADSDSSANTSSPSCLLLPQAQFMPVAASTQKLRSSIKMDEDSPEIVPVNSPALDPEEPGLEPESSESGEGDRDGPPEALSDKLPLPPAELNLYRVAVALRLVLLAAFFRYRVTHPARGAPWLWLAALVSRETKPGFQHHTKAGALNALLRVSALLTNGSYVLNLDHDHCIANSGVLREAMCFLMDPEAGNRTCFVQFPLRIGVEDDGGERHATRDSVFFDIDMKCLDGIQGPVYVVSGCCFNRKALYGFDPAFSEDDDEDARCTGAGRRRRLRSYRDALERHFGHSPEFIASAFVSQERGVGGGDSSTASDASSLLSEAIHVVSCTYEERTRWGKDIGWMYGSGGGGVVTGFRMHACGWASAYCAPARTAFRSFASASPSDVLAGASQRAVAAMGAVLSRHCPVWSAAGGRLRLMQRLGYVSCVAYPLASLPLTVYCALPAACLLTSRSIFPDDVGYYNAVLLILLLSSVVATVALELRWSGVTLRAWWRDQKLWVVIGTSACLAAVFQGILRSCAGVDVGFSSTSAGTTATRRRSTSDDDNDGAGGEEPSDARKSVLRWSNLLIPPASLLLGNLAGVVVAVSYGVDHGYRLGPGPREAGSRRLGGGAPPGLLQGPPCAAGQAGTHHRRAMVGALRVRALAALGQRRLLLSAAGAVRVAAAADLVRKLKRRF
ncbi:unnamed protein product [Miscanthus lutarioriparius]|uniref:Transcription factor HY5 n=1 Tax=Miscanthus lutarioriparius TaxID=422564 RepID=A0A811SEE7_9POAL|nr:unnamed protein product [Miscanthus lutarioriparius]